MKLDVTSSLKPWTPSSPEGRWSKLGPYYAMFPVSFVREAISRSCPTNGGVLDPFCGRGTAPFVAQATGRASVGIDLNPVGWVFSSAKVNPEPDVERVLRRIKQIAASRLPTDRIPSSDFQEWAWCPDVLSFLNSARRNLDWKGDKTDRTLAAILLVHLHGKLGNAASNQMRQSKSMAPDYAVRWWSAKNMTPPQLNPVDYFEACVRWRYAKGIPGGTASSEIMFGDARIHLPDYKRQNFKLLLTSPPYCGVTNYRVDNWIRLWLLGDTPLPNWETSQRYVDRTSYKRMIFEVFHAARGAMSEDAVILVRTDTRTFTRDVTAATLRSIWPSHVMFAKSDVAARSQTDLFGGQKDKKPGETDLLLVPKRYRAVGDEFAKVPEIEMASEDVWRPDLAEVGTLSFNGGRDTVLGGSGGKGPQPPDRPAAARAATGTRHAHPRPTPGVNAALAEHVV
jgi:hypothetical protein